MPWRCEACGADVAEDGRACPTCAAKKANWTLFAGNTRRFVVAGKRFVVLRGQDSVARRPDDPARADDPPVEATRAVSVRAATARDLAARGLLPPSRDVLLVRLLARGDRSATARLTADYGAQESDERELAPFAPPDAEGALDVPLVLVHGPGGPSGITFPGLHVVDVTDGDGHATDIEVVALKRPPVRLPVHTWTAARLLDVEGRPVVDAGVVLVLGGGERRPARTDADGQAWWEDVPAGTLELELEDAGFVPELAEPARRWTAARVLDGEGRPAADVGVILITAGERRPARTDADGVARWEDVPEGPLELELEDEGFLPELADDPSSPPTTAASAPAPGEHDALDDGSKYTHQDEPGRWTATRLVEPDGRPAAGVTVTLVQDGTERRDAVTDADGRARWDDVPPGATLALELAGEEFVPELAEPDPDEPPARPAPTPSPWQTSPPDEAVAAKRSPA